MTEQLNSVLSCPPNKLLRTTALPTFEPPRTRIPITYDADLRRVYCLYYGQHTIQDLLANHSYIIYK
jgi:hypothetical protein